MEIRDFTSETNVNQTFAILESQILQFQGTRENPQVHEPRGQFLCCRRSSAPARLSIDQMWEAQAAPKRAVHDNPFNNIPNTAGFFS